MLICSLYLFLVKGLFKYFAYFLLRYLSLYIVLTSTLSDIFCIYFSPVCGLLFVFLSVSFKEHSFYKHFLLRLVLFCVIKKSLPNPVLQRFSPVCSCRSYTYILVTIYSCHNLLSQLRKLGSEKLKQFAQGHLVVSCHYL